MMTTTLQETEENHALTYIAEEEEEEGETQLEQIWLMKQGDEGLSK